MNVKRVLTNIVAPVVGTALFGAMSLVAILPDPTNGDATTHYSSAAARDRALRYYFATHPKTTTTQPTVTVKHQYGGYETSTPGAITTHYAYTYGHGLRATPYEYSADYVGAKVHVDYVPDTSGNTPSNSIAHDFAPSIRKYHASMPDATTMHVNMNTSKTSWTNLAGTSHGWSK